MGHVLCPASHLGEGGSQGKNSAVLDRLSLVGMGEAPGWAREGWKWGEEEGEVPRFPEIQGDPPSAQVTVGVSNSLQASQQSFQRPAGPLPARLHKLASRIPFISLPFLSSGPKFLGMKFL